MAGRKLPLAMIACVRRGVVGGARALARAGRGGARLLELARGHVGDSAEIKEGMLKAKTAK